MLDSVTFVILNVLIRDFFLFPMKFQKCQEFHYFLKYKEIKIDFYVGSGTLVIQTNAHKLLNKDIITIGDLVDYKKKLYKILYDVFGNYKYSLLLSRIDYCVDLTMNIKTEELKNYLELLYKHDFSYRHAKIHNKYNSSFYMATKRGSYNLNFYSKYEQMDKKDEKWKGTFRLELQIKKSKIKRECVKNKIERKIENYWIEKAMDKYFFEFLQNFLHKGNYYRLDVAENMILNSDYSGYMKNRLIDFIRKINKDGMSEIKKTYNYATRRNYIKKLEKLNINPVTLNVDKPYKEMENLLEKARKTAKKLYF